jgi:hypothetical protein
VKAPRDRNAPTRAAGPLLQKKCSCGASAGKSGQCDECAAKGRLNRKRASAADASLEVPDAVFETLRTSGEALDADTRTFFEEAYGHDFSRVRIHADDVAARSAKDVNAQAYTVGEHVVFGDRQYAPHEPQGTQLLAHELAHVVQQRAMSPAGEAGLKIAPSDAPGEREADRAAAAVMSEQSPALAAGTSPAHVARRPAGAPFRPPPVRVPTRPPARAPARPGARPGQREPAPMWVPEWHDDSLDAHFQRHSIRDYAERQRIEQERPVATLTRGGSPPHFITEHGTRTHTFAGGPGYGGSVTVRIRKFHVLDRIEHDVSRANTEEDLQAILAEHAPNAAMLNENIGEMERRARGLPKKFGLPPLARLPNPFDAPVFPQDFDPRAEERLETFTQALEKRAAVVPTLANSRLRSPSRKKGGCLIEPIDPLGNDPLSSLYCHLATGSPFSYKITILGQNGQKTQRWAEIDSLRGNTWYECKCGYEKLIADASRGEGTARAILEKMDKQVLNHREIAQTCGLTYRFVVSSERVAEILRERWNRNIEIYVIAVDICD